MMLNRLSILLVGLLCALPMSPCIAQDALPDGSTDSPAVEAIEQLAIEDKLESNLRVEDVAAASTWIQSTGVVDWLGPLAPVALSPFFGVTCLSGLALWGPEWVTDNALIGSAATLRNQRLFVVFLGLTIVTSLPRLTKVSKPIAQALDRLETYSVILILLAVKFLATGQSADDTPVAMVQLGVISFTADTLLALAMAANVLVISSVKFFFEFLVWLTPIPLVDAIFEACNKLVCAALMAIYAFSPTLATCINLFILLIAAVLLRWISRRVRFYRTMILDPLIAKFWTGFGQPKRPELIVFPKEPIGPFPAKSRLRLSRRSDGDGGWVLENANWWRPAKQHHLTDQHQAIARRGWIMHHVTVRDSQGNETTLSFSRRYDHETLEALCRQLGVELVEKPDQSVVPLKMEFS